MYKHQTNIKTIFLKKNGFTIVESMVTMSILVIIFIFAIPMFKYVQKRTDLNQGTEQMIKALRLAQKRTLSSQGASQWGVYFATSTTPNNFVLFSGASYATRASSLDEIYEVPSSVEISSVGLYGSEEVVFERLLGTTNQSGSTTMALINDAAKTATVYIDSSGQVGRNAFPTADDALRGKDSRHVHFTYDRVIGTSTEDIILTFDSSVVEAIVIADNLVRGQLFWQDEVDVNGDTEQITIKTIRLNNPDTLFCILRDRGINNKSLEVDISGDASATPNLVGYSADGLTTSEGNSIWINTPIWQ